MTRRDACWKVSQRMRWMSPEERAQAWRELAGELEDLAEKDVPKFRDLLYAVLRAGVKGRMRAEEK